jgi:hypothetical protein
MLNSSERIREVKLLEDFIFDRIKNPRHLSVKSIGEL